MVQVAVYFTYEVVFIPASGHVVQTVTSKFIFCSNKSDHYLPLIVRMQVQIKMYVLSGTLQNIWPNQKTINLAVK